MDYISGWCKSKRKLHGMTAIVTGSNTGIGRETALDFYLRGAHVIMACRDIDKANMTKRDIEKLHQSTQGRGDLAVQKLDLGSLQSVREFASVMLSEERKIDILVNNAGVVMCLQGLTEDGFETHMGTNHFGHALLTLLLLPVLVKSDHARIVFVSSIAHESYEIDFDDINFLKTPYDPFRPYSRSKVANILFARALSHKLREHNIHNVNTYSLHPGLIATDIGRNFSDSVLRGATWFINNIYSWFIKSPRCGAQTTIYCAVDEHCADETGLYYSECHVTPSSEYAQNMMIAEKLWKLTIELLKLEEDNIFCDLSQASTSGPL